MRGMLPRVALLMVAVLTAALFGRTPPAGGQPGQTLYVNNTDPTCGGLSPCYGTIQGAVDAAGSGDRIVIQPGTYVEQVRIQKKNNFAEATEADRIIIEADPAAPAGSVVLDGAVDQCTQGFAIKLSKSKFITLRSLTITGAGGQGIALPGGISRNQAIHIEKNRIFGNGSGSCNGGITINRGNADTLIVNNLISANGRNGITFLDATGGPHHLVENTIHANRWSGVKVARNHEVFLVNNVITQNGTAGGSTGGRFGIKREGSTSPQPEGIHLLHNLICGNRLGEIQGPALDATDSGNLTPTGTEGPGVTASPGCEVPSTVYADVDGADDLANTADDDFALADGSPVIDQGLDPRTLGLDPLFDPLFEADFAAEAARPKDGDADGSAEFDLGALEVEPAVVADTQPPDVVILEPLGGAVVSGTITLKARASDAGSGVASVTFGVDGATVATLGNTADAEPFIAQTSFDTTTTTNGEHTLGATATDNAGNVASTSQALIVGNPVPSIKAIQRAYRGNSGARWSGAPGLCAERQASGD